MTDDNGNDNDNYNDNRASSPSSSSSSSSSSACDSERELGRHDYWESTYERELETLRETGDEGEVWFGARVNDTVADFCAGLLLPKDEKKEPSSDSGSSLPALRVVDVGCGNGALLLSLALRGFRDLTGSDYSERALLLAKAVVDARKVREAEKEAGAEKGGSSAPSAFSRLSAASFSFVHDDATDSRVARRSFDAATDKGTLDAVGLSAGGAAARRSYLLGVSRCLKRGGLLIVTSVNSTLEELRAEVEALEAEAEEEEGEEGEGGEGEDDDDHDDVDVDGGGNGGEGGKTEKKPNKLLSYVDHVRTYPVYSFGGRTGARVATVAFRKQV